MKMDTETRSRSVHVQIVEGYNVETISKKKLQKESFLSKLNFDEAKIKEITSRGQQVLEKNGIAFAYKKDKKYQSFFLIQKNSQSFDCEDAWFSSDVSEEDQKLMVEDIKRQIALLNHTAGFTNGTCLGEKVPLVRAEKNPSGWLLALVISFGFGMCLYPATKNLPLCICLTVSQGVLWYSVFRNKLVLQDPADPEKNEAVEV
ncbi:MAG: hypothetical protein IKG93_08980 [Clostridiales bacterium]|nr:hypothetical protein [Clostridiales bacterium]